MARTIPEGVPPARGNAPRSLSPRSDDFLRLERGVALARQPEQVEIDRVVVLAERRAADTAEAVLRTLEVVLQCAPKSGVPFAGVQA